MVHALKEIWRVLVPSGTMVDLRPLGGHRPLDIVSDGKAKLAGRIDRTGHLSDDLASQEALAQTVRKGLFRQESEQFFEFPYVWDSVQEMEAYVKENWTDNRIRPRSVLDRAHRLLASSGDHAKVRIRTKMVIGRYRKIPKIG
ncbi:MAG: hypothetical protein ACE5HZ_08765 [Fidelibacterota bacterium]